MGEYAPITAELRRQIGHTMTAGISKVEMEYSAFEVFCDNIDSIHKRLEQENKRLREELDRALSEQDDAAPEKPRTVGKLQAEVTVTSHLDFEGLARDLEEAARAVRSIGGDDE